MAFKKNIALLVFLLNSTVLISQDIQPITTIEIGKSYEPAQKQIAKGKNGMVSTQHYLATEVGEEILNLGGNAYDASVAVSFALAVVLPRAGNIGGGGFMVLYDSQNSKSYSLDYREKAPSKASRDMYLQKDGLYDRKKATRGYLASGVPGTVAGLWEVHKKFGSMPWNDLIQPAIKLAENGFRISPYMAEMLLRNNKKLSEFESSKVIFQSFYPKFENNLLIQKDLAQTLKLIANEGKDAFYRGSIAKKISMDMKANGGIISMDDLKNYSPIWREPLKQKYRDVEIFTMGPPSSGGVHVIQMLNVLKQNNLNELGHNSSKYINLLAEVMKFAYADRSKYLGDSDFYDVPIEMLTSDSYAKRINQKISLGSSLKSEDIFPGMFAKNESFETTHFSVVDKNLNVVSSTTTLNSSFGSGVVIKGTGILMNNEMDDFSSAPGVPNIYGLLGSEANEIAPNKRPLSSMTPTIVLKDNSLFFTTGSPGGSRIISAVLQSILNIVDFGMNLEEATSATRVHHQWQPDILEIEHAFKLDDVDESHKLKSGTINELLSYKYRIKSMPPVTNIQTIMYDNNIFYGYGDYRRPDSLASGNIYDR